MRKTCLHTFVCHSTHFFPQVAGVLELLMGDVCQPFYYTALGLEQISSKRRALRVMLNFSEYVDYIKANGLVLEHKRK